VVCHCLVLEFGLKLLLVKKDDSVYLQTILFECSVARALSYLLAVKFELISNANGEFWVKSGLCYSVHTKVK